MNTGPFDEVKKKYSDCFWFNHLDNVYAPFVDIDLDLDLDRLNLDNDALFANDFKKGGLSYHEAPKDLEKRKQWIITRAITDLGWFLSAPFRGFFSLFKTKEVKINRSDFKQNPALDDVDPDIKTLAIALNANPIKACNTWLEGQNDEDKVASIVWLITKHTPLLDPTQIGEILSEPGNSKKFTLSNDVLKGYLAERFDFEGKSIAESLKEFLEADFKLPGEAQKIDRFMAAFSEKFLADNPRQTNIADKDSAYILAFSLVMLQTNLHNPNIKDKMSLEQFKSQVSGTNNTADYDPDFLASLYRYIQKNEIKLNLAEKQDLKPIAQQILDQVKRVLQLKKKPTLDANAIAVLKTHPDYQPTDSKMQNIVLAVKQSELAIGREVPAEINLELEEEPVNLFKSLKSKLPRPENRKEMEEKYKETKAKAESKDKNDKNRLV
jgi:hypothetical protein